MYNLTTDEYYENRIKELERELSRLSADNMKLRDESKEEEKLKFHIHSQMWKSNDERDKMKRILEVTVDEIADLRKRFTEISMKYDNLKTMIDEDYVKDLEEEVHYLKSFIQNEYPPAGYKKVDG